MNTVWQHMIDDELYEEHPGIDRLKRCLEHRASLVSRRHDWKSKMHKI